MARSPKSAAEGYSADAVRALSGLEARIAHLYATDQLSLRAVASEVEKSLGYVQDVINAAGLMRTKSSMVKVNGDWQDVETMSAAQERKFRKRYATGKYTIEEVAAHVGCSHSFAARFVAANNLADPSVWTKHSGVYHAIRAIRKVRRVDQSSLDRSGYYHKVRKLTENVIARYGAELDPKKKRERFVWVIDHRYSLQQGYDDSVCIFEMCHPVNLKLMRHGRNAKKHARCSHTLRELRSKIKAWNAEFGDPFDSATVRRMILNG